MNINDLIEACKKPEFYSPGTHEMSDDEHILKQILFNQLNPDTDYSSRRASTVKRTFDWILGRPEIIRGSVLDLGCGPGLYTELFAEEGFRTFGIDISGPAVEYASSQAAEKGLNINYKRMDYLDIHIDEKFDLIIMIYNMFSSLLPDEREKLLASVRKLLKPEGVFIFDVINDKNIEKKAPPPVWQVSEKSFWSPKPHLYLQTSFLYNKEKIILVKHLLSDLKNEIKTFNFWVHHYSHSDLDKILETNGFLPVCYSEEVLPENDWWDGSNISFISAK